MQCEASLPVACLGRVEGTEERPCMAFKFSSWIVSPTLPCNAALIRLEEDQTKNGEARTISLPDVLVEMLRKIKPKEGVLFDVSNLRKAWQKACVAAGLGTYAEVAGKFDPRYTGLIIRDLRRSALKI